MVRSESMHAPEKLEAARVRAALRRKLFGTKCAPSRVGRYELVRSVGAGAMGAVFVARDTELERDVALKVLRTAEGADVVRRRLLREARAMAKLRHPNVVAVFEAGVVDDTAFIAMEYVEGTTLRDWLGASARELDEIVDVFAQAAHGLAAAHAAGLIHRDFKPDNVLVGSDRRAQVTDFGIARGIDMPDEQPAVSPSRHALSSHTERARAGTPRYMAPEQHMGASVDARTDQFTFFVALHEALTGASPFPTESLAALARAACHGEHRPLPAHVPPWLRELIRVGLHPDPAERHPSMDHVAERLRQRPDRSEARAKWPIAAALIALAAIGVAVATRDGAGEQTTSASAAPTTSTAAPASAAPSASASSRPLGTITVPDGTLAGGDPWLAGFRLVHHDETGGLTWLEAAKRCRAASLSLCTDSQWQRACQLNEQLASRRTWTATADATRGFVVRGSGSCVAREVAPDDARDDARGGMCCSRSVAMVGERRETADRIMSRALLRLESALSDAHIPTLESMTGDRIDHGGDAMSKDRFLALLLTEAKREPERWEVHDVCEGSELTREGERAWTAACRTLLYRAGRLGSVQRRYTFSGPHGTLSGMDEPEVFRELSAPAP